MKIKTSKFEHSSGAVVYRRKNSNFQFLLGKHSGYHKWVLPKGLIEKGEDPKITAFREVEEETGIKAKIIGTEPIKKLEYFYVADTGETKGKDTNGNEIIRRVIRYQENGGKKVSVRKQVEFYLMEYVSGNPKNHDWEMEDAGWFSYNDALEKMAFEGEKQVLTIAGKKLAISQ